MDFANITTDEPNGNVVEDIVYVTRWSQRWLKHAWQLVTVGGPAEHFAKAVCAEIDTVETDPTDHLDYHEHTQLHRVTSNVAPPTVNQHVVRKAVIRRGHRSRFAASLSKIAYNKFGERPMTEANILVTRRWLQKLLEGDDYRHMRVSDKNLAIDRALFLFFVPTLAFQKMRVAVTTAQWEKRMDASQVFGGFWSKIFGVGRLQDPDLLESH